MREVLKYAYILPSMLIIILAVISILYLHLAFFLPSAIFILSIMITIITLTNVLLLCVSSKLSKHDNFIIASWIFLGVISLLLPLSYITGIKELVVFSLLPSFISAFLILFLLSMMYRKGIFKKHVLYYLMWTILEVILIACSTTFLFEVI